MTAPDTATQGPVVQYVCIEGDAAKHDALSAVLLQAAEGIRCEPGARTYQLSADLQRRGVFHLYEEWDSAADLERHGSTPGAAAMLARMTEFGIARLDVHRYGVNTIDGAPVPAAP